MISHPALVITSTKSRIPIKTATEVTTVTARRIRQTCLLLCSGYNLNEMCVLRAAYVTPGKKIREAPTKCKAFIVVVSCGG